jgi:hypothetical protein
MERTDYKDPERGRGQFVQRGADVGAAFVERRVADQCRISIADGRRIINSNGP